MLGRGGSASARPLGNVLGMKLLDRWWAAVRRWRLRNKQRSQSRLRGRLRGRFRVPLFEAERRITVLIEAGYLLRARSLCRDEEVEPAMDGWREWTRVAEKELGMVFARQRVASTFAGIHLTREWGPRIYLPNDEPYMREILPGYLKRQISFLERQRVRLLASAKRAGVDTSAEAAAAAAVSARETADAEAEVEAAVSLGTTREPVESAQGAGSTNVPMASLSAEQAGILAKYQEGSPGYQSLQQTLGLFVKTLALCSKKATREGSFDKPNQSQAYAAMSKHLTPGEKKLPFAAHDDTTTYARLLNARTVTGEGWPARETMPGDTEVTLALLGLLMRAWATRGRTPAPDREATVSTSPRKAGSNPELLVAWALERAEACLAQRGDAPPKAGKRVIPARLPVDPWWTHDLNRVVRVLKESIDAGERVLGDWHMEQEAASPEGAAPQ